MRCAARSKNLRFALCVRVDWERWLHYRRGRRRNDLYLWRGGPLRREDCRVRWWLRPLRLALDRRCRLRRRHGSRRLERCGRRWWWRRLGRYGWHWRTGWFRWTRIGEAWIPFAESTPSWCEIPRQGWQLGSSWPAAEDDRIFCIWREFCASYARIVPDFTGRLLQASPRFSGLFGPRKLPSISWEPLARFLPRSGACESQSRC